MFHAHEITICGYSGSGKTTLAKRLIGRLTPGYRVGYVKHSGHRIALDARGKDTAEARAAGAVRTLIATATETGMTTAEPWDFVQQRTVFDDCDLVLAEGWKSSPLPRLVVLDEARAILDEAEPAGAGPVWALVGREAAMPDAAWPYFQRDDVDRLAAWIVERLRAQATAHPLYGLVLAGGRSTRMQRDKASLVYAGRTQLEIAYELVASLCEHTYVSARRDQWDAGRFERLPRIDDTFLDCGPAGGMLSAMAAHPQAAWLVVACDLPFIDRGTLEDLVRGRNPFKVATAYTSANDGLPEPLCAVYEPRARGRLLQFLAVGYQCPRKMLINSNTALLALRNPRALDNVNRPDEYEAALQALEAGAQT